MERSFSAYDLAAAILADLRGIDGAEKYFKISYGAEALIDAFAGTAGCPRSCPEDNIPDGQNLRAKLGTHISGTAEPVHAFYQAVLAYEDRADKPDRLCVQRDDVLRLAHLIFGAGRMVRMPQDSLTSAIARPEAAQ